MGAERQPVVLVGDRVRVSVTGAGEGVLEQVLPRTSELSRQSAGGKPIVVAANVDRLLVVSSVAHPRPSWTLVDRMLVSASRDGVQAAICLNKWDLLDLERAELLEEIQSTLALYGRLGYDTFAVSALRATGLAPLLDWLRGHIAVFSGHSGVGKSTLLNQLIPGLEAETQEVNRVTGKGRHTTSGVQLYKIPTGGYAADTPGFREFQPADLPPEELGRHYPEIRDAAGSCRFNDCLHRTEPHCAVRKAVEGGGISKFRYDNYLQILSTLLG